jgi:hypothetical protein
MGSYAGDKGADKNEYGPGGKPLPVPVPAFRIAAYPVTCAQFRPFVEGDGYGNPAYWTKAGWEWKESQKRTKPYLWDDPRWNIENRGWSQLVRSGGLVPLVYGSVAGTGVVAPGLRDPLADRSRVGMGGAGAGWPQVSLGRYVAG